jgi:hypothetical protein
LKGGVLRLYAPHSKRRKHPKKKPPPKIPEESTIEVHIKERE